MKIAIPLYREIPQINMWNDGWEMNGVDTEVNITTIRNLQWDTKKGNLIIHCRCQYYVNEYHENYKSNQDKPKFKIIK